MKKLQKLSDPLFTENQISVDKQKEVYGGYVPEPTKIGTALSYDCTTHAATGGETNHDSCDSSNDDVTKDDKTEA